MDPVAGLRRLRSAWSIAFDPLFDAEWCAWTHPGAPRSRLGAALDAVRRGGVASPDFDPEWYLREHPDVARACHEPLVHYVRHGRREGRALSPLRRRAFADDLGQVDRERLRKFLSGTALRSDRTRAVPHLRAMIHHQRPLFGRLLALLASHDPAAARYAIDLALQAPRMTPVAARIVIEANGNDVDLVATLCSLAADPEVDPSVIEVEGAAPPEGVPAGRQSSASTTVRVSAGALVLPGSVASLAAAGQPAHGAVVGPDGSREDHWRRAAPVAPPKVLRATIEGATGPSQLAPNAVAVVWDAQPVGAELPRALVVDQRLPKLDRDSGSASAVSFMESLIALGYRVTFVPVSLEFDPVHSAALESRGIEVVDERDVNDPAEVVGLGAFDLALLLKPETVERFAPALRAGTPATRIVSVPMDAHFVRVGAAAALSGRPEDAAEAARYRAMEFANLGLVDLTVTGSADEVTLLRELAPAARIDYLPPARAHVDEPLAPPSDRTDLVFLGGFEHPPNLDGLLWFLDECWPAVAAAVPDARLVVYGSAMPDALRSRATDRVIMHGYVADLADAFRTARVFVVPLRYGAGYKGKIVSAMHAGVPIVTTSVGGSGMELESVVVADGAGPFAAAVIDLWNDAARLDALSTRTRAEARARYSPAGQREVLARLIGDLR